MNAKKDKLVILKDANRELLQWSFANPLPSFSLKFSCEKSASNIFLRIFEK
jgi:hypothetical protein